MSAPTGHALFSPSAAHRWMACAGSLVLEEGIEDKVGAYAAEGTAAHELASWALEEDKEPQAYIGRKITINERDETFEFVVGLDMAQQVQVYTNRVREYRDTIKGALLVEQKVEFSNIVGTPDQFGTADAIIVGEGELQVHDLKFGRGVRVDAPQNQQLMLYALAAYYEYNDLLGPFDTIRVCIHQPRISNHFSEWDFGLQELFDFEAEVKAAVASYQEAQSSYPQDPTPDMQFTPEWLKQFLNPGKKQCQWCKVKATCPALRDWSFGQISNDFEPAVATADEIATEIDEAIAALKWSAPEDLGTQYTEEVLDGVENWIKAIRAKIEADLFAGKPVSNWKLVEGKRGHRKWESAEKAEEALTAMRVKVDDRYKKTLISPTDAEKLLKVSNPRKWNKLQDLITQADGKPSVAPVSDPRPAWAATPVEDDFANEESDGSDLF